MIKDRVIKNAAMWIASAERGEISYETASLLVNTLELAMAEFAEETGQKRLQTMVLNQVADINQYLRYQGVKVKYPPTGFGLQRQQEIASELYKTVNFRQRQIMHRLKR